MLRQSAACWLPCKVIIVKINHWFGFYSWLVVDIARWFVSQQVPSASLLSLGSKLYPSNKQRMLNEDPTRFMQSLIRVRQNRASERKALLAGCTSFCSKFVIISKIFSVGLKLLRPNYIFPCAPFNKEYNFIFWEYFYLECQINSLRSFRQRPVR